MKRQLRIIPLTLGLAGAGALVGARGSVTAVLIASLLRPSPRPGLVLLPVIDPLIITATIGASIGAMVVPVFSFALLRRVPLGRAILVSAITTLFGAALGEASDPFNRLDPRQTPGVFQGALLGFLVATPLLRLTVRSAHSSSSVDRAV